MSEEFELQRVRFYEISAKVIEKSRKQAGEPSEREPDSGGTVNVEVGIKNDENQLGCRLSVDFSSDQLLARVDCAAFFKKVTPSAASLSEDALKGVAQEVVLVLVPYIREALAEITRRVAGKPVMLGTVRINDLFSAEDS